jgi:hypothetical protein
MPRRTSTNSSDEDDSSEEGIASLLILTQAQRQRFIEKQQRIIRKLIRDFAPDRIVFYTTFDTPQIVQDDTLEDILGVQKVIYKIIFEQTSRTTIVFYSRDLPEGTFTHVRGERDDIPEGPPNFDSDGHEIITDEEFSFSDDVEINTDEESE